MCVILLSLTTSSHTTISQRSLLHSMADRLWSIIWSAFCFILSPCSSPSKPCFSPWCTPDGLLPLSPGWLFTSLESVDSKQATTFPVFLPVPAGLLFLWLGRTNYREGLVQKMLHICILKKGSDHTGKAQHLKRLVYQHPCASKWPFLNMEMLIQETAEAAGAQ